MKKQLELIALSAIVPTGRRALRGVCQSAAIALACLGLLTAFSARASDENQQGDQYGVPEDGARDRCGPVAWNLG